MENTWSLQELYTSFQDETFLKDFAALQDDLQAFTAWCSEAFAVPSSPTVEKIETYLHKKNQLGDLYDRLYQFAELTAACDTKNNEALTVLEQLQNISVPLAPAQVQFSRWLCKFPDLEACIRDTPSLVPYHFYLTEMIKTAPHLLSPQEELLIESLKTTGSMAWTQLQETLTSSLSVTVSVQDKLENYPLSYVRGLAYDASAFVRKAAYEAELSALKTIEESSAACLNAIKGEVITVSSLRGYESVLQMTLLSSRMHEESLSAMLSAMEGSLSSFRRYFHKKAELLCHFDGLPFYDLFAPIGKVTKTYTYQQAQEIILACFYSFSQSLGDYAEQAFLKHWIDVYPRTGKRGGAFCSNLHSIKESRILTNFTGSFNDVITIAHELGHGYHGSRLDNEAFLNSDYPMPIAETASTFCETIVKQALLSQCSAEERKTILEADLADHAQIVVDILSRFYFEDAVFEKRKTGPLSAQTFCSLMLAAQKKTYGDGLSSYHPYLWIVKPHYYDADYNYYNFPYAFGLLFAKGLYQLSLEKGASYAAEYDTLLNMTGRASLEEVAAATGFSIRNHAFWKNALSVLCREIDDWISL